jgi:hypothetical protein
MEKEDLEERITCIRYCNNQYLHIKYQDNYILINELKNTVSTGIQPLQQQ